MIRIADWLRWVSPEEVSTAGTTGKPSGNHKYAIEHEGKLYPVKEVISMVTGCPHPQSGGDRGGL